MVLKEDHEKSPATRNRNIEGTPQQRPEPQRLSRNCKTSYQELRATFTSANTLWNNIYRNTGLPASVVSD